MKKTNVSLRQGQYPATPVACGYRRSRRILGIAGILTWESLLKIPGQALPGHHSDSGTHDLNRGHQRPRQESSPERLGSKVRARNRICGDAGWVIVGSPGDNARANRFQQQSHPSSCGKRRHERVGTKNNLRITARIRSHPAWRRYGGLQRISRIRATSLELVVYPNQSETDAAS